MKRESKKDRMDRFGKMQKILGLFSQGVRTSSEFYSAFSTTPLSSTANRYRLRHYLAKIARVGVYSSFYIRLFSGPLRLRGSVKLPNPCPSFLCLKVLPRDPLHIHREIPHRQPFYTPVSYRWHSSRRVFQLAERFRSRVYSRGTRQR